MFLLASKVSKNVGYFCEKVVSPGTFKNRPIWSQSRYLCTNKKISSQCNGCFEWYVLTIFCWSQNPLNWSTHSKLISQNSKWLSYPLHPTSVQFFNESLKSVKNSFWLFLHEVSCYSASPDNDRASECYLGTQPLKSPKTQKAEIETTR